MFNEDVLYCDRSKEVLTKKQPDVLEIDDEL